MLYVTPFCLRPWLTLCKEAWFGVKQDYACHVSDLTRVLLPTRRTRPGPEARVLEEVLCPEATHTSTLTFLLLQARPSHFSPGPLSGSPRAQLMWAAQREMTSSQLAAGKPAGLISSH